MTRFDPEKKCPLLNKKCITHQCQWYICVQGTHPNTGQPVDEWGCAVAWLPVMTLATAQESRQAAAAVESFRNETVRSAQMLADEMAIRRQKEVSHEPIRVVE